MGLCCTCLVVLLRYFGCSPYFPTPRLRNTGCDTATLRHSASICHNHFLSSSRLASSHLLVCVSLLLDLHLTTSNFDLPTCNLVHLLTSHSLCCIPSSTCCRCSQPCRSLSPLLFLLFLRWYRFLRCSSSVLRDVLSLEFAFPTYIQNNHNVVILVIRILGGGLHACWSRCNCRHHTPRFHIAILERGHKEDGRHHGEGSNELLYR